MLKKLKSYADDWVTSQKKRFPENKRFQALTMCKKCYTFYYKRSWHFERPEVLEGDNETPIPVCFTECPACLEQEVSYYDMESGSYAV
jgi:hypothetical protein